MMVPLKTIHLDGPGRNSLCLFLGPPISTGVFVCSSIPVVLFDTPEISKYLKTLFLLSPHLYFITGFICDLFVAHNESWMS